MMWLLRSFFDSKCFPQRLHRKCCPRLTSSHISPCSSSPPLTDKARKAGTKCPQCLPHHNWVWLEWRKIRDHNWVWHQSKTFCLALKGLIQTFLSVIKCLKVSGQKSMWEAQIAIGFYSASNFGEHFHGGWVKAGLELRISKFVSRDQELARISHSVASDGVCARELALSCKSIC